MILKNKSFNIIGLLAIVALLVFSNFKLFKLDPILVITQSPPPQKLISLNAMGDKELLFRYLSLELQYMGDSYGRSSNINAYDYEKLYYWFSLLDSLDHQSNFVPATAAYYFGFNYNKEQLYWIIRYLKEHSWNNLEKKWWWLYQASYLAYHRQKDYKLAIELAERVSTTSANTPIWLRQLPAIYYANIGEYQHALKIIENILITYKDSITPGEKNFMDYFINERLNIINNSKGLK